MSESVLQYVLAGVLLVCLTVVMLTGHSSDPGADVLFTGFGIAIGALFGHGIAKQTANDIKNGTLQPPDKEGK